MSSGSPRKRIAAGRRIYAAGGVRDVADLAALARASIAGALIATALHDGRVSGAEIAALSLTPRTDA